MKILQEIKNNYAQEQGFEDWETLIHSVINHAGINGKYAAIIAVEKHLNEICLRAQRAVLENAAENTSTQYVRPKTFHYKEIEDFITNEQNLIR